MHNEAKVKGKDSRNNFPKMPVEEFETTWVLWGVRSKEFRFEAGELRKSQTEGLSEVEIQGRVEPEPPCATSKERKEPWEKDELCGLRTHPHTFSCEVS